MPEPVEISTGPREDLKDSNLSTRKFPGTTRLCSSRTPPSATPPSFGNLLGARIGEQQLEEEAAEQQVQHLQIQLR